MKLLSIILLSSLAVTTHATVQNHVAKFNADTGWPAHSETIAGMDQILSIKSVGNDSFALGFTHNKMPVAFYNEQAWGPAYVIPGLKGVSAIVPVYPEVSSKALAVDIDGKSAFFDGSHWTFVPAPAGLINVAILASNGQAWAVQTPDKVKVSQFDMTKKVWQMPVDVSDKIVRLREVVAANGVLYLLGTNAQNQVVFLSDRQGLLHTYNFNEKFAKDIQLRAVGDKVLVLISGENTSLFAYSLDQGKSFHETAAAPGVLLQPGQKMLWEMIDKRRVAYFDFKHLSWQSINTPEGTYKGYAKDQGIGEKLCLLENGPAIDCYDTKGQKWHSLAGLKPLASQIDMLKVLDNTVLAFGADNKGNPTAFSYDGKAWHANHIKGLNHVIGNFSSGNNDNVWLIGD